MTIHQIKDKGEATVAKHSDRRIKVRPESQPVSATRHPAQGDAGAEALK